MTKFNKLPRYLLGLFFLIAGGCQNGEESSKVHQLNVSGTQGVSVYADYLPVKVEILPLTEVVSDTNSITGAVKIKAYVSLLDSYESQIKAPVVLRFEMYDYVRLSANPKGRRVMIWPDVNLNDSGVNNRYWRDFLRAYEVILNMDDAFSKQKIYVFEVTCTTAGGRRLSKDYVFGGKK